ncbi:MAG: PAS domain-containing protein, partial [Proteobacteria bacterium]|nr:PAS domain-containing protein [Pseudomonadota bacterium]
MTEVITHDANLVTLIGGKDVLRVLVEQFYGRLAADKACQMILANFDLEQLTVCNVQRIAQVLGDSSTAGTSDASPLVPTAPRKMLARVDKHFKAALIESGVPEQFRLDLTQAINPLKTLVCGAPSHPTESTTVTPPPATSLSIAQRTEANPIQPPPQQAPGDDRVSELSAQLEALSQALALVEFNPEGRVLSANSIFLSLVGHSLVELKGTSHNMLMGSASESTISRPHPWDTARRGECVQGEFQLRGKSGQTVWLRGSYTPVVGPSGGLNKLIVCGFDISQEMAAREQFKTILQRVERSSEPIGGTSRALQDVCVQLWAHSGETRVGMERMARAAEEAQRHMGTMANGTEEMGSSIRGIAANAADAAEIATKAVRVTTHASETVGKLGESSTAIGKFVKVIKAIAEQTNLLALNATIEAARAG